MKYNYRYTIRWNHPLVEPPSFGPGVVEGHDDDFPDYDNRGAAEMALLSEITDMRDQGYQVVATSVYSIRDKDDQSGSPPNLEDVDEWQDFKNEFSARINIVATGVDTELLTSLLRQLDLVRNYEQWLNLLFIEMRSAASVSSRNLYRDALSLSESLGV
jgi:hypothetical protein